MSEQRNLALVAPIGTPQVTPVHALSPGAQPLASLMIQQPRQDLPIPVGDTGTQYLSQGPTGPIPISQSIDPSLMFMPGTGAHEAYQANLRREADIALSFGPGIIGGERAVTAALSGGPHDVSTLEHAMAAEQGIHAIIPPDRDAIFYSTGWFRGADDKWRFIIPDEGARLKTENMNRNRYSEEDDLWGVRPQYDLQTKLPDVLEHPTLFEAYPHLKDVDVRPMPQGSSFDLKGSYNPDLNRIRLTGGAKEGEMLSTLLHETQHAVQHYEGFARGGGTAEFLPSTFDENWQNVKKDKEDIEKQIYENYGVEPLDIARFHGFHPFNPADFTFDPKTFMSERTKEAVGVLPQNLVDSYRDVQSQYKSLSDQKSAAFRDYFNLSGEIEARSVQAMMHEHKWSRPPWEVPMGTDFRGRPIPYPEKTEHIIRFDNPSPGGPAGVVLTPVDHDPFAVPPGEAHGEVVPFGRGAEIRGEQQTAKEAAQREKTRQGIETLRQGLLPQPSYPLPNEVKDALGYFDQLGFDTRGEAIGALRQSGKNWKEHWDIRPNSELIPMDDLAKHRDQQLYQRHVGNLEKFLAMSRGTWVGE